MTVTQPPHLRKSHHPRPKTHLPHMGSLSLGSSSVCVKKKGEGRNGAGEAERNKKKKKREEKQKRKPEREGEKVVWKERGLFNSRASVNAGAEPEFLARGNKLI